MKLLDQAMALGSDEMWAPSLANTMQRTRYANSLFSFCAIASLLVGVLLGGFPVDAARDLNSGYQGVEFYGSSLITRGELEKSLGLKQGASYEQLQKALPRFKERLRAKNINFNVDVATEGSQEYVTVDILETGMATQPTRKIAYPHHIDLSSELPLQVFGDLLGRREDLARQGRPVTETYDERGLKHYSDEPCNQYAEKIHRQVPGMQSQLISVVANDPDGERRSRAVEVLNWTDDPLILCVTFIPAIDDASQQVRFSVARFIQPRIKMLPPNFPFVSLVEGFSHQLMRPNHLDRMLALRCLTEIARTHPEAIEVIKEFDEDKVKQLQQESRLDSIKQPATELLQYMSHPPARPRAPKSMPNEF